MTDIGKWPPTPEGYVQVPTYPDMFLFVGKLEEKRQNLIFERNHTFRKARRCLARRLDGAYPIAAFRKVILVDHFWHGETKPKLPVVSAGRHLCREDTYCGPYAIGVFPRLAENLIAPYNYLYSQRKRWKRGSEGHLSILFRKLGYEMI